MNCSAIGHSIIIYHWEKYNTINNEWTKLPTDQQNYTNGISTYRLAMLTKNDDGLYQCVATNIDGSGYSNNVTITVYGVCIMNIQYICDLLCKNPSYYNICKFLNRHITSSITCST